MLKLHHILGLRALCPFDNLEFDFLTLFQGAKAFARDGTVVDEDIRPVGLGNKSIAFGIAEPFDRAFYPHGTLPSQKSCPASAGALPKKNKRNDRKAFLSGKGLQALSGREFNKFYKNISECQTGSRKMEAVGLSWGGPAAPPVMEKIGMRAWESKPPVGAAGARFFIARVTIGGPFPASQIMVHGNAG
jgi:hypothetical protein